MVMSRACKFNKLNETTSIQFQYEWHKYAVDRMRKLEIELIDKYNLYEKKNVIKCTFVYSMCDRNNVFKLCILHFFFINKFEN